MRCPYCQHTDTKVTDSRTTDEGIVFAVAENVSIVAVALLPMKL